MPRGLADGMNGPPEERPHLFGGGSPARVGTTVRSTCQTWCGWRLDELDDMGV